MKNIILTCIGCLFLFVGMLISLFNWFSIIAWARNMKHNRYYRKSDGVVPFLGGLLLVIGCIFFLFIIPNSIIQSHSWMIWIALLVDYGSLPALIISPLLGWFLSTKRKTKQNVKHNK